LAAEQTLLLIKQAYLQGNLIDAHLLLRRLFELIIQYIFFASLKKKKQYPSESLDQTEMTSDEKLDDFYRIMDQMQFDDSSLTDWSFFHQWAAGNPMGAAEKKKRRGFLSLKYYLDKIKALNLLIKHYSPLFFNTILDDILDKMNDYTHGNTLYTSIRSQEKDSEAMVTFRKDLAFIFSILLSYLTIVKGVLLHSSDYEDALEKNEIPESESQYWIAPAIQHYFDMYVQKSHPRLLQFLQQNNPSGMVIEGDDGIPKDQSESKDWIK
jgi:hypothetical protein